MAKALTNTMLRAMNDRAALSGDYDGVHYHIWIDLGTLAPQDSIVYKNPPQGTRYRGDGWFATRKLSQSIGSGKTVADLLLAVAPSLVDSCKSALAAEEAEQAAQHAKDAAEKLARDCGPELLTALQEAQHYLHFTESPNSPHMVRIAEAIAKATAAPAADVAVVVGAQS